MKQRIFSKPGELLGTHRQEDDKRRVFGFEQPDQNAALQQLTDAIDNIDAGNDIQGNVRTADGGFWNNIGGIIGNLGTGAASVISALNNKHTVTETYNTTTINKTNRTLMWGGLGVAALLVTGVVLILVLRKK